ncbi:MAG: glycosyltransferase family 4 protein [Candidatus Heimdallarchaeota archaeon]|nr:glycosyltransferase family 4 protein [Candidatus Heimdallarchaeota archaeon]MCG3255596.1 glycosyltransferase family 4 protein [Candidatus Heimdallarchaeota archaeon]MCK4610671.1 glycosyltransferase family 4 protein [Candidatus Heimdallarchaeota archaeon]
MDPLKIVQVTPFFGSRSYGGTERYVSNLSTELANRGHHIDVFTTKNSTKVPYQSYYKNMTVHRFYSPWNVFGINPACFMFHKMLQLKDIDVFHVHSYIYFTTIQAALTKLLKRTPLLLHIHGGVGRPPYKTGFLKEFAKLFYDYTLGKFVLSQADIIASVSLQDSKLLEKTIHSNLNRIIIVNNAINPEDFPEISPVLQKKIVISYVGDLEPWKGILYYSKVINRVLKQTKNISFWFVGNGSLYSALKDKFEEEKRVKLFGAVDYNEIPKILEKTHILVQPSFWEGSPTTIIEAMAMGIPVVASNIGDIPRLLNSGGDGILFEAGNENQLEEIILNAAKNYNELVDTARKARSKIRKDFAFKNVTNQIEDLYYKLVS